MLFKSFLIILLNCFLFSKSVFAISYDHETKTYHVFKGESYSFIKGCSIVLNKKFYPVNKFKKVILKNDFTYLDIQQYSIKKFKIDKAEQFQFINEISNVKKKCYSSRR